jgi:tyrosine-protein kinase Etk/Wzc
MEQPHNQHNLPFPEEDSIDIKKYIFLILSRWWLFGISIFISLTIAYLINRYSAEVYQVSSSMVIGEEGTQAGSIESMLYELTRAKKSRRKAMVENEISILRSYSLSRMAIEELPEFNITYMAVGRRGIAESQLYRNCPFVVIPDTLGSNAQGFKVNVIILSKEKYRIELDIGKGFSKELSFGEKFEHDFFSFTIFKNTNENSYSRTYFPQKYYFYFNDIHNLANAYRSKLFVDVNADRGSIISFSISGAVPAQISDYLNKLSEVYIRSNLNEKNEVSDNTIAFIDQQLKGIVDSLESAGIRLQQFRSNNKLIDLSKEGSFLFEQMEQLQADKALLEINLRYYNYLLDYIKTHQEAGDVIAPSVVGISDELLNSLVLNLNELSLQLSNYRSSVQENLPQTTALKGQINNVRNTLQENLASLIGASELSMENLNNRIRKIEGEIRKLPLTERQYINIQRDFNINDQIYTFLLEKRAEAGITKASNIADHKILDKALPNNAIRIRPKPSSNYMLSLVVGFLIPLIIIILREFFNNKILGKRDIESATRVPILGSVGHNEKQSEIPVFENPKTALSESFRALRANLHFMLKEKNEKVIAVSSTISGEGKTFCAVNLAAIMAMAGKKTLLMGLDLRRPKIHRIFNINNDTGLSTYLAGRTEYQDIIQPTNVDNLAIVISGPVPPNPAELIGSERLVDFIDSMKKEFDYIVIDTPPIAIVTDALLIKDLINTYVFVIRHNYSDRSVLKLVDELYTRRGVANMSILVNDIQVKGYYGYNYSYNYGYGYGYTYRYGQSYYDTEMEITGFWSKLKREYKRRRN